MSIPTSMRPAIWPPLTSPGLSSFNARNRSSIRPRRNERCSADLGKVRLCVAATAGRLAPRQAPARAEMAVLHRLKAEKCSCYWRISPFEYAHQAHRVHFLARNRRNNLRQLHLQGRTGAPPGNRGVSAGWEQMTPDLLGLRPPAITRCR